jgi:hypothetical protein
LINLPEEANPLLEIRNQVGSRRNFMGAVRS